MKAFACSELASIAFEMDMETIEEIGAQYDHELVDVSNYIVANSFERCMNSLPHSLAVSFLENEDIEPDQQLLSYVYFDYSVLKTYNPDTSLTKAQEDLIDAFTAAVEKLSEEEGFFDDPDYWGGEEEESPGAKKRAAETTELLQDEIYGITLILGVMVISSVAIVGGVCYFLSEQKDE